MSVIPCEYKVSALAEQWTSVVHFQLYFEGSENTNNYLASTGSTFLNHSPRPKTIPIPMPFTRTIQLETGEEKGINQQKSFSKF